MGVKGTEIIADKKHLNYSIVNVIGGKYLRVLRRPNKNKKYNNNISKDRDNRAKKLALLSWCPSK
jgi:hypothetical protein